MIPRMLATCLAASAVIAVSARPVQSQTGVSDDLSKFITTVLPAEPSLAGDIIMRVYAEILRESLGKPLIIDNKPGGNGACAAAYVTANAKPDGYLLSDITIPIYRTPAMQKTSHDPVKDFQPVILPSGNTLGSAVKASSPFESRQDVIDFSKANCRSKQESREA